MMEGGEEKGMQGEEAPDEFAPLRELLSDEREFETRRPRRSVDPAVRRRRRRRGALIAGIVVALVLGITGAYTGWALNAPVGAPATSTTPPAAPSVPATPLALPANGAMAVSVTGTEDYLGASAGGILASSGGDEPRPIASVSKLVTAMVVLDARPLDGPDDPGPTLRFGATDHALYDKYYLLGATIASMPEGSSMSEHDALETMLVVSACNYAEAVATWAFGSEAGFRAATADWLARNGLAHTTIVEPTGVDARNTSSPSDLLAIGRLAMANPAIAQIVRMPRLDVPGLDRLPNTNDLLGVRGVTGLKTGTLDDSGSNLLFSADVPVGSAGSLSVVGVMLGGYSHAAVNDDVVALLDSIVQGFHVVPLAPRGAEVATATTPWGASARVVVGDNASLFTWSDTPIAVAMDLPPLTGGSTGDQVGTLTWTAGPNTASVPLVLDGDLPPPTAWWRLTHPADLG